jgi:hypothetical protein
MLTPNFNPVSAASLCYRSVVNRTRCLRRQTPAQQIERRALQRRLWSEHKIDTVYFYPHDKRANVVKSVCSARTLGTF